MSEGTGSLCFKNAEPGDIDEALRLINSDPDHLLPRDRQNIELLLETFYVAKDGETVVGCTCLEVYSPKIAEIRSLVVAPEYRKLGVGRKLVELAVAEAERRSVHEVLVVTSSPEFFERLGFGACLNEKYALFWGGDKGVSKTR